MDDMSDSEYQTSIEARILQYALQYVRITHSRVALSDLPIQPHQPSVNRFRLFTSFSIPSIFSNKSGGLTHVVLLTPVPILLRQHFNQRSAQPALLRACRVDVPVRRKVLESRLC